MATNANMDWTQTGPGNTGYPPAFRSGNMNPSGPSHEADVSYLLRDDVHDSNNSRPQYAPAGGYHSHGAHFGPSLHAGLHASGPSIEEQFWPHQNDPAQNESQANETVHGETAYDEPAEPTNDPDSDDDEAPDPGGPTRPQKTTIPRSERRKHYKPKPDPSNPRLFRPFDNLETVDTTLPQWRLPPIVGSYVMFPNKKLKHNPMPPDVDAVREKLFKMDQSILFKNSQEVADYVPHVTNYWRRAVQRHEVDEKTGLQVEYWHCRSKKVKRPPRRPEHVSKGIRNREKKSVVLFEDQELCRMRIRVTSFTKHANTPGEHERWGGGACKCVAEWVHFEKACIEGTPTEHTHDQEIMDTWKRSEAVAVLAKVKCEEGNSYAAVSKWLRKNFGDHSKQVYKFEKGDVANAAQKWRNDHKDLVLREEVPEDSEEMTTMRHCVDAILEADADALRAALREVIKDSDALTKSALAILKEKKPDVPAKEVPEEPWQLSEGISVYDLPFPGATQKLREASGAHGPPRAPLPHWRRHVPHPPPQPAPQQAVQAAQGPSSKSGPDGRPIPSWGTPGTMAASQGDPRVHDRQQHMHHQSSGPGAVNAPPTRGVALQPRPDVPTYGAPSQPGAQPPTRVEIRYVYPPAPPPPPPQKGCVHPITFSMEVPSCPLDTCRQCRHMRRGTAGRTFYFQDKLHTTAHFTKLQNLLRDPMQLLDDDYTRVLHQSAVASVHPHPALHTEVPQRSSLHRPPPPEGQHAPAPDMRHVQHIPPPPPGHVQVKGHPQGQLRPSAASAPTEAGAESNIPPGEADDTFHRPPQSAATSVYDQPLPVPITIEDDDDEDNDDHNGREDNVEGNGDDDEKEEEEEEDKVESNRNDLEREREDDDDDDEQPPAKRQKQGSPVAED